MVYRIMISIVLLIFSTFEGSASICQTGKNKQAKKKSFIVYNALLYKHTPDLSSYGLRKIFLFYEDSLLTKSQIIHDKIKRVALRSNRYPNIPVCFDIESWMLDDANVKESLSKYLEVVKIFKKYNNKSKVGYYGVFPHDSPHKEYWYENDIRENVIMKKWRETNNNVKNVGLKTNLFFPSFYTRNKDMKTWKKMVQEKVSIIRSTRKDGKIYGFIWPQYYHDNGSFDFINQEQWKFQLETLYTYCDGIVIWSHYLGSDNKPVNFDYNMPWFQTTIQFINKYKIAK